jgi:hypothetical protein
MAELEDGQQLWLLVSQYTHRPTNVTSFTVHGVFVTEDEAFGAVTDYARGAWTYDAANERWECAARLQPYNHARHYYVSKITVGALYDPPERRRN